MIQVSDEDDEEDAKIIKTLRLSQAREEAKEEFDRMNSDMSTTMQTTERSDTHPFGINESQDSSIERQGSDINFIPALEQDEIIPEQVKPIEDHPKKIHHQNEQEHEEEKKMKVEELKAEPLQSRESQVTEIETEINDEDDEMPEERKSIS